MNAPAVLSTPSTEIQAAQQRLDEALATQARIMERFHRHQAKELMSYEIIGTPQNPANPWIKLTFYDRQTLRRGQSFNVFWNAARGRGIEPRFTLIGSTAVSSPVEAEHAVQLAEHELARAELRARKATRMITFHPAAPAAETGIDVITVTSWADLQPGDVFDAKSASGMYTFAQVYDSDTVLAFNPATDSYFMKLISHFEMPRAAWRFAAPCTSLDAVPSEADQEAADNQRKAQNPWAR